MPQTYTFPSDAHKNLQFLRMSPLFLQPLQAVSAATSFSVYPCDMSQLAQMP
jgi:hypothetical protein